MLHINISKVLKFLGLEGKCAEWASKEQREHMYWSVDW